MPIAYMSKCRGTTDKAFRIRESMQISESEMERNEEGLDLNNIINEESNGQ